MPESLISSVTLHEKPCGCYYETSLDMTGEVCLIRARTCSACFDEFLTHLEREIIDHEMQLTLDLPSRRTPEGKA